MNKFECNLCYGKGQHLHWCPRVIDSVTIHGSGQDAKLSIPMTGTWGEAANALSRSGVELRVETETIADVLRDAAAPIPERIKVDPDTGNVTVTAPDNWSDTNTWTQTNEFGPWSLNLPEPSGWVCYLWGTHEKHPHTCWYPPKGQVPNAFVRWMMKVCFACTWVKEKP